MGKILLQADYVNFIGEKITVAGWAVGENKCDFHVYEPDGKEIPCKLKRSLRKDVIEAVDRAKDGEEYGFTVTFENTKSASIRLVITDGVSNRTVRMNKKIYSWFSRYYGPRSAAKKIAEWTVHFVPNVREMGVGAYFSHLGRELKKEEYSYHVNFLKNRISGKRIEEEKKTVFAQAPLISLIVPAYRTPEKYLRQMLDSVEAQTYPNWELCVADGSYPDESVIRVLDEYNKKDPRVRYTVLKENYGISGNTNAALDMVKGDWVALMDHDDLLEPDALYEVVSAINRDPAVEAAYTDEDKVTMDLSHYFSPTYKPDYDIDMLRSGNYICHLFCVKKSVIDAVGPFNSACDGSQDYDFILRCTEKAEKTAHIPKMLYHWRSHPASTAENPENKMYCYEAGKRAVNLHLQRKNLPAQCFRSVHYGHYYTFWNKPAEEKLISVILWGNELTEEKADRTRKSMEKISDWKNFEFIEGIENAEKAKGEYLLFIKAGDVLQPFSVYNSGTGKTVTEDDFGMKAFPCNMIGLLENTEASAVGGRVLDANDYNFYAGAVFNAYHACDYMYTHLKKDDAGYLGLALDRHRVSSLSLHLMMVSKETYLSCGGIHKLFGHHTFSDTDFCYTLLEKGGTIVYDPTCVARTPDSSKKYAWSKHQEAAHRTAKAHGELLAGHDPYVNPNLLVYRDNWVIS